VRGYKHLLISYQNAPQERIQHSKQGSLTEGKALYN
jgi:hypothetical protein